MKILINIGHPAHVHFYKNFIWQMEKRGHYIKIVTEYKEVTIDLLNAYNFKYESIGSKNIGMIKKGLGIIRKDYLLYQIAKKFKPDVITGIHDTYGAHVGMILKKPSIVFTDTEHAKLANIVTFPFASVILTPSCFKNNLGKKQIRYDGYHELAYLHPNYFTPDQSVLNDMGLNKDEKFIILRLVSWNASHDIHSRGFSDDFLEQLIKCLEKYARVYIISERKLSENLEKYKTTFSPEKLHSLLYYSSLYIGEGGTTAVEATILGTPSIHLVSVKLTSGEIIGASQIHGNFDELVNKYGILYSYVDQKQALDKALDILQSEDVKKKLSVKRKKMFEDKIDVTSFLTDFIEKYPQNYNLSNN